MVADVTFLRVPFRNLKGEPFLALVLCHGLLSRICGETAGIFGGANHRRADHRPELNFKSLTQKLFSHNNVLRGDAS